MSTETNSLAWGQIGWVSRAGTRRQLSPLFLSPLSASACFLLSPRLLSEGPCPFAHQRSSHRRSQRLLSPDCEWLGLV